MGTEYYNILPVEEQQELDHGQVLSQASWMVRKIKKNEI